MIVSTQSPDLLSDAGIAPEEVLLLQPSKEDTLVRVAANDLEIRMLLEKGASMAEAVFPRTAPQKADQLVLFGDSE
jgi:hypothetical protein